MNSVYAQLTCIGLTVAGFLALVVAATGKQEKAGGNTEDPESEFKPEELRDLALQMLLDEGMDPMEATQHVEDILHEHPDYELEELLEEARRR